MEIQNISIRQTGSGINTHHWAYGKYLKCQISRKWWEIRCWTQRRSDRKLHYPWAFDWHRDLWRSETLNRPKPRSLKLHVKCFENGDRYDDGSMEDELVTSHELSNGTMTVNLEWPWTVHQGHRILTSNMLNTVRDMTLDTMEVRQETTTGFQLAPWPWITLNRLSSRSLQLQSNISITVYGLQQHWADTRSRERISC